LLSETVAISNPQSLAVKWPTILAQYCAFNHPLSNQNLTCMQMCEKIGDISIIELSLTMVDLSVFTAHKPQCWGRFEART
jgi:hypothetical protein